MFLRSGGGASLRAGGVGGASVEGLGGNQAAVRGGAGDVTPAEGAGAGRALAELLRKHSDG